MNSNQTITSWWFTCRSSTFCHPRLPIEAPPPQHERRHDQTSRASLRWLVRSAGFRRGWRFPQKISSNFLNFPQISSNFLDFPRFSSALLAREVWPVPPPLPLSNQQRGDITTSKLSHEHTCEEMSERVWPWRVQVPLVMSFSHARVEVNGTTL